MRLTASKVFSLKFKSSSVVLIMGRKDGNWSKCLYVLGKPSARAGLVDCGLR